MLSCMLFLLDFSFPSGNADVNAFSNLIADFSDWIVRIGGLVMFAGAVKFALALKDGDTKDKTLGILTFVAGAIIIDVANKNSSDYLFQIPRTYTNATAHAQFAKLTVFISKWIKRAGGLVAFAGATELALSIRNNDAGAKVSASYTFVTGFMLVAIGAFI